jgi:hypothetical protein
MVFFMIREEKSGRDGLIPKGLIQPLGQRGPIRRIVPSSAAAKTTPCTVMEQISSGWSNSPKVIAHSVTARGISYRFMVHSFALARRDTIPPNC